MHFDFTHVPMCFVCPSPLHARAPLRTSHAPLGFGAVGADVGASVGACVGEAVGTCVGALVGASVGVVVDAVVGATVVGARADDVAAAVVVAVAAVGHFSLAMQAAHPPGMLSTKSSQHVGQCARTLHVAVRQS